MAISLYEVSVASYLQTLGALAGCLDKGAAHCLAAGIDPESLVETRLAPDMRPLRFQVTTAVHQSLGAIDGMKAGLFRPPSDKTPYDYAGLRTLVDVARAALAAVPAAEIEAMAGTEVVFETPVVRRVFTAEGFVLSFSLPNFYFHATTAYDILRMKGVPLGKRDFVGALRVKG